LKVTSMVQRAAVRSLVVFVIGIVWFIVTPYIFIWGLPQFQVYKQWMTNYGTDAGSVYLFWTMMPEVGLFVFGIFWAGGIFETVRDHLDW